MSRERDRHPDTHDHLSLSLPLTQTLSLTNHPISTGVKARHLETALPPVGGVVLVLKGPHRMKKAKCVSLPFYLSCLP